MRKRNRIMLAIVLVCVLGVGVIVFGQHMKKEKSFEDEIVQEKSSLIKTGYEETRVYFEIITLDMLNECDEKALQRSNEEFLKAYDENSLIFFERIPRK